jgi:hypothetical protein
VTISQLLTLLLGGGAVATITAMFNGIKSLREGSRGKEHDTIASLITDRKEAIKDRDKANDARDFAYDERDYWRNWAGRLEYVLIQHGIALPEKAPLPQEKA